MNRCTKLFAALTTLGFLIAAPGLAGDSEAPVSPVQDVEIQQQLPAPSVESEKAPVEVSEVVSSQMQERLFPVPVEAAQGPPTSLSACEHPDSYYCDPGCFCLIYRNKPSCFPLSTCAQP